MSFNASFKHSFGVVKVKTIRGRRVQ